MELTERIQQLLGTGLSGSIVASTVGVEPSYISQLMEQEGFKDGVLHLRAAHAEESIKRDGKWDGLESAALAKMEQLLPMVTRPSDIIRIAQIANSAKRAAKELANGSDNSAPTVQLIVPEGARILFKMNAQAQVVEVEGRSMAALPTQHLTKMMNERKQERLGNGEPTEVLVPQAVLTERKKVATTLEQIGYSDEPPPVQKVLLEMVESRE